MGMTSSVTAAMSSPKVVLMILRCRVVFPLRYSSFNKFVLESCLLTEDLKTFRVAGATHVPAQINVRKVLEREKTKSLSVAAWFGTDSDEEDVPAYRQLPRYRLQRA